MRWILPTAVDAAQARELARTLRVAPFVAELLLRRGFSGAEDCAGFLEPRLKTLRDPFLLPDMERAIERIIAALERRERIVLYGDYDVDGVTSLALLTRVLRASGADVQCFLPLRIEEGYGLSADGAKRCVETLRPELLIAVDCGTSSRTEIATLRAQNVDVIVVDHHEVKDALPDCVAVVNPKRGADFQYLCSAGLAFKVAHSLLKRRPVADFDLRGVLDLVALGTVADLVPITAENRVLVKSGLRRLAETRWPGVRALIEVAGISAPLTSVDIGYKLGPRLNAAGRLGTAQAALDLLLTDDPDEARRLAKALDEQNRERRAVEDHVHAQAEEQLAGWFDATRHAAIVVGGEGWHPGVVGIVASRLSRRHHRPVLVVGFDENGIGKGSGRSIEGLPLVHALTQCGHLLERFGGHEMAAGLSMHFHRLEELRAAFCACAGGILNAEQLQPRLHLDAELTLAELDYALLEHHDALQPFGMGNRQPTLLLRGVHLTGEPRVLKEKHLSLTLRQDRTQFRAIWFGSAAEALPRLPWDVAFELERNEYQGTVTPQIQVRAVRASEA